MKQGLPALALLAVLLVTACGEDETAAPPPVALTEQAVGHLLRDNLALPFSDNQTATAGIRIFDFR